MFVFTTAMTYKQKQFINIFKSQAIMENCSDDINLEKKRYRLAKRKYDKFYELRLRNTKFGSV